MGKRRSRSGSKTKTQHQVTALPLSLLSFVLGYIIDGVVVTIVFAYVLTMILSNAVVQGASLGVPRSMHFTYGMGLFVYGAALLGSMFLIDSIVRMYMRINTPSVMMKVSLSFIFVGVIGVFIVGRLV